MAGLWCVQVGYGNKELADAGCEALNTLPFYNHFFKTTNPWTTELAAKLVSLLPAGHTRVLFANSGSEANDTALKLIRYYWNLQGKPRKENPSVARAVLSRRHHGGGVAVGPHAHASAMGSAAARFRQGAGALLVRRETAGYGDIAPEEFGLLIAKKMEEKILDIGPDKIASFSAEPVQGAGGLIIPPSTYWPEVSRICKKYDILLHADEVITGFGRTGEWFGSQTSASRPTS